MKALHCESLLKSKNSGILVVIDFKFCRCASAGGFVRTDYESDGLPKIVDFVFGEQRFVGPGFSEGVLEWREILRKKNGGDAFFTGRTGPIFPSNGGRGMGAFDD